MNLEQTPASTSGQPSNHARDRLFYLLIPVAALIAVLPLLREGPSCGHDLSFHILSWLEAAAQLTHGGYPHWAFTPAWNAGEPRFLFYPPLSWMLGAVLGMILPWLYVPAAFTFCCLAVCGLVFARFARAYVRPPAATLIAILYLANPYMLFVAYERTAYAELLAAAWLPLLFVAAFAPRLRILPVAFPLALLWLTNVPAAIMGSYSLAFLLVLRLVLSTPKGQRLRESLNGVAGALLGLALAGIFLVPAVYERRFISPELALLPGLNPSNHFLFNRMPAGPDWDFHNAVVLSVSIVSVTLLLASALAFIPAFRAQRKPALLSGLLTLLILFLLVPPSLPVWNHLPELAFVQFPWRFNALLGTILGVLAVFALSRWRRLNHLHPAIPALAGLLLAIALVLPAWHYFQQVCDDEDAVPARVALYHSSAGSDPIDEYTPNSADGDSLDAGDPGYWLLPRTQDVDSAPPATTSPAQAPNHVVLTLKAPQTLILNRRAYRIWRLTLNRHPVDSITRTDGLLALELPAGISTVDIVYHRPWEVNAGEALSLAALLIAVLLYLREKRPLSNPHRTI
jgi:hypothetical protein